MAKKSGGKIFLIVLGFLVLAGALALIALGLVFVLPDIAKIFKAIPTDVYYLAGGIAGILLSIIILILAFKKAASPSLKEKEQNQEKVHYSTPVPAHSTATASTIKLKEKEIMNGQPVICEKCGTENLYGDYYCSGCKSALKKICKLCGHDNPCGTEVCEGCGRVMQ